MRGISLFPPIPNHLEAIKKEKALDLKLWISESASMNAQSYQTLKLSSQGKVLTRGMQQGQTQLHLTWIIWSQAWPVVSPWGKGWERHMHFQAAVHSSYGPLDCPAEILLSLHNDRWRPNHQHGVSTWFLEGSGQIRRILHKAQEKKASQDITRHTEHTMYVIGKLVIVYH